jgi:flagellar FliJ protein
MPFRFRLQSVLDHRAHREDLALQEFALRLNRQREAEEHIAWLEEELDRARRGLGGGEGAGVSASDFQLANEYATVLRLQALRARAKLPELQAHTEQARKKLMLARKDRLTLDTLKERHRRRHERETLLAEQRVIDEAAVGAHLRRSREE